MFTLTGGHPGKCIGKNRHNVIMCTVSALFDVQLLGLL